MSAEQQMFPTSSLSFPPGALQAFPGLSSEKTVPSELETLRMMVKERLTAAVDDILEAFEKTVFQYREQIDLQRRQLDSLRSEEDRWKRAAELLPSSSWMKSSPEEQIVSNQLDHTEKVSDTDANMSVPQIKTEVGGEDCGASEPNGHFDSAAGSEQMSESRLLTEYPETEDSEDYWRDPAAFWKPEESQEPEGHNSSLSKSSSDLMLESDLSHQPAPLVSCKVCGESFQRTNQLLNHAPAHLTDCGLCGKHLEHTENLKLHLKVHREASYSCSICGQGFTLRGNLRTHMRIHSGERPYSCTVCGKSFGRRATLVRHVRSHTGEKPFICTYCGHSFVEKGNLTVHLRTHTGERPYWCSVCNRRFSQLSCFYKHPCQRRALTSDCSKP